MKVSLPQATILSDAIDTTSFGAARTEQRPQPIGVEDVTQYIDESRQEAEAAAISGEVLNGPRRTPSRPLKRYSVPPFRRGTRSKSARRRRTRRRNSRFG
ncbi:MAG: hypothetical protein ACLUW6_00310 [Coriobacteriaceae bacterium]